MTTHRLAGIKAASMAKDTEEKRTDNREKAMLFFAFQLLVDKGYIDTATTFASECSLNLEEYSICENIDLNTVFVDFEAYYNMRFQRYPQYFRKLSPNTTGESVLSRIPKQKRNGSYRPPPPRGPAVADAEYSNGAGSCSQKDFSVVGNSPTANVAPNSSKDKLLKPVSALDFLTEDTRHFADMIQQEIVTNDLGTVWDDIVGSEQAKIILLQSLVYRDDFVEYFGNVLPPWTGLLLYGPPGTGKTLLARAVASECNATFFNVSSASLVSKWRGDSEKIVKVLFELAKYHAPSIIFFDEFDALGSNRDSGGESDASRRLKSQLLQEMDGLLSTSQAQLPVFILAATNLPWELDPAIIRRLEKRIHISLPNAKERCEILKLHFAKTAQGISEKSKGRNKLVPQIDFDTMGRLTDGFSGSDLQQLIKETIIKKFQQNFQDKNKLRTLEVTSQEVIFSLENVSPTVKPQLEQKFTQWNNVNPSMSSQLN